MIQDKKDLIVHLAEKAARQCGVEIYNITVQFRKKSLKIDVRIDNGAVVSHEDCSVYSRAFSRILDDETGLADYTLEVSSPGLNRLLRTVNECRRFVGSPVKVVYSESDGYVTVKGELVSVDGSDLTVREEKGDRQIVFDSVKTAQLDY
ncbi:MAG: ribosome maturation factor RimP [Spirochaetota bacterium]